MIKAFKNSIEDADFNIENGILDFNDSAYDEHNGFLIRTKHHIFFIRSVTGP